MKEGRIKLLFMNNNKFILIFFAFIIAIVLSSSATAATTVNNNSTTTSLEKINQTSNQNLSTTSFETKKLNQTKLPIPYNTRTNVHYTTIQSAINGASPGDTIKVESGIYKENLVINKNIILMGENADNTIIDGQLKGSVISITYGSNVTMNGFTIQNGNSTYGGGIINNYVLTLKNSVITNNSAINGGGIIN